jgi:uncharacterized membrane protein YbhN (UPF0104 family)
MTTAILSAPPRGARQALKVVWGWARLVIGAGIIGGMLWRLGTGAFLDGLRVINCWMLLATAAIGLLTTVLSAWRWCLVARGLGMRLSMRDAVADYYRALFINAALPSGILGDVHRAVRHGKDAGDVGKGVRAVVLERFAGQVVLVSAGLAVLLTQTTLVPLAALPWMLAALAAAGAVLFLLRRKSFLVEVRRALLGRRNWPGIFLASAVVVGGHVATFVVAARAAGATAPIGRLLPLMMLALLAMTLPVNIGGWGPREGVTAWAFGAAGLGAAQGFTVAVVYGLFAFVASLPGIVVLVRQYLQKSPVPAGDPQQSNRSESA